MTDENRDALRFDAPQWPRIAIVLYIVIVAFVTLSPGDASEGTRLRLHCVMCSDLWLRDVLLNVLLFVPLGWLGARTGVSLRTVTAAAALLSFSVELAQLLVPSLGRFPILGDLLANTIGAAVGAAAPKLWILYNTRFSKRSRVILGGTWMVGVTAVSWWLVQPALPSDSDWYAVAAAELGHLARFPGAVEEGRINGLEVPFRLPPVAVLSRSPDAASLEIRATVRVTSWSDGLAPIISIFDGRQREVTLLGVEHGKLVLRVRTNAVAVGLPSPSVRLQGLAGPLGVGSPWEGEVTASVSREGWCVGLPRAEGSTCSRPRPHWTAIGLAESGPSSLWQSKWNVVALVGWWCFFGLPALPLLWPTRWR